MQRLLRRPHVSEMTGLPRTTLYAAIAEGRFPAPVRIGRRAVAWREADVLQWLASRPDARA
jgi:prophage regulatory protein